MDIVDVIYVAIDTGDNRPIASSDCIDTLLRAIDNHYGANEKYDFQMKRISFDQIEHKTGGGSLCGVVKYIGIKDPNDFADVQIMEIDHFKHIVKV